MKWIKRQFKSLIARSDEEMDQLPEVLGYRINESGQKEYLRIGPKRRENLTDDQVKRITRLREVLSEVYPMTLEGWIDGFLRDLNPEIEIRYIEACAVVYGQLITRANLSREEKGHLYTSLCRAISSDGPYQIEAELYERLKLQGAQDIVALVRGAIKESARP